MRIILLLLLIKAYLANAVPGFGRPGGFNGIHVCTETEIGFASSLQKPIETGFSTVYSVFNPLRCSSQVVAGTVYWMEIAVTADQSDVIYAKIFVPLPYTKAPPKLMEAFQTIPDMDSGCPFAV